MSRAPITHRVQYRLFDAVRRCLYKQPPPHLSADRQSNNNSKEYDPSSSISASMPWAETARLAGDGAISVADFRRYEGVCHVVETVGPPDGRFYADRIREWGGTYLIHPQVRSMDRWGKPIRLPGWFLGTPEAFSPTTLRYLATALWLQRQGFVTPDCMVVELGIGFGGLAGMNAVVSRATTILADLPQVVPLAVRFLSDSGLNGYANGGSDARLPDDYCFLSNYAFTELSADVQEIYLEKYIRRSSRGVIISNAQIFSVGAGGRSDADILSLLRGAGLPAEIIRSADILGPSDKLCDISIINWHAKR